MASVRSEFWRFYPQGCIVFSKHPFQNACIIEHDRDNGVENEVGCSQHILDIPPAIGSTITVKHVGYYQSGAMRHPFYYGEQLEAPGIAKANPKAENLQTDWTRPENHRRFFDGL